MKLITTLLFIILSAQLALAQKEKLHQRQLISAIKSRAKGDYNKALKMHKSIYAGNPNYTMNNFFYACLFSLLNQKDSCIKYLNKSTSTRASLQLLYEPDLYYMHQFPEWDSIEAKVLRKCQYQISRIKDFDYAKQLYHLGATDKAFYNELRIAEKKYGNDSKQVKTLWTERGELNQQNQLEFEKLLAEKGWPTIKQVGREAALNAYFILKHADLDKMKKYTPIIKKYCEDEEGICAAYAVLFDRIQVSQNKPQRYGTQVRYNKAKEKYEFCPFENEGMLQEYRKHSGLPLIENYARRWNIEINIKKNDSNFIYADSLVKATLSPESKYDYFHGFDFTGKTKKLDKSAPIVPVDPKCILGGTTDVCLTMPKGTEVIVMFTDNQIVDYPNKPDIYIKEYGGAKDKALVSVSHDGITFDSLGITYDARSNSLDLASINYTQSVRFIKIVALDNNGGLPGYDLMYIQGLAESNVDATMTEKEIKTYLQKAQKEIEYINSLGPLVHMPTFTNRPKPSVKAVKHSLVAVKEKIIGNKSNFILKELLFDLRSSQFKKESIPYLNQLVEELKEINWKKLIITGHTDNIGTASANEFLSLRRAIVIRDYLILHGVKQINIECVGLGATRPLRSNDRPYGRAKNRRTEINIIK